MAGPEVLSSVRSTCEHILGQRGLELVDLRLVGEPAGRTLRITVDRLDQPVPLDEIAEVSEAISRALDAEDPIEGRYFLEVSSAGLERPLVKPSDFSRFAGRQAKVKTFDPIEGRRHFEGVITSSGSETFVIKADDSTVVEIPFTAVERAKLVVDWDKELKGLGKSTGSQRADEDHIGGNE